MTTTYLFPNDVVECIVTASDDYGASDLGNTSFTISNRAPNVPAVNITWNGNSGTAIAGDSLTCTFVGTSYTIRGGDFTHNASKIRS